MMTRQSLLLSFLFAVTVLLHWPVERADFVYDDRDFIETNQSIRTLPSAFVAFLGPFPPEQSTRALYRPLTNVSYAVDYALWGNQARGFHVTNVLLYGILVLSVYALAQGLLGSSNSALAAALLFAVHPVHCDAVDSLAGRSEILALLFCILSLLAARAADRATDAVKARRSWLVSAGFYLLACLSKETGAVLPAVLAVWCWTRIPAARRRSSSAGLEILRKLWPHAVVFGVYGLVRFAALGQLSPDTAILGDASLLTRFSTMGAVYFMDLQLLIAPTLLEVDFYYQALIGILDRPGSASVLGWAGMGLLGVGALRLIWQLSSPAADESSRSHDARTAALMALALFFVFLFPTSHFIGFGALMAERFLFAPSLGFVLLIVIVTRAALANLGSRQLATTIGTGLVLVTAMPAAIQSRARADEWRDEVRLWSTAARHIPGDIRVHTNLAAAHLDRGQINAAREHLGHALEIDPTYREALGNLASVELEDGNVAGAIFHYRRMLEFEPGDFLTWNNLGIAELRRKRYSAAIQHFERALEINPNFALARSNLDAAYALRAGESAPRHLK